MSAFSVVPLLGIAGCGRPDASIEEQSPRPIVAVRIDSVRVGSIADIVAAPGNTRALRQENLSSPIEGKVTSLQAVEGDAVRHGDVVASILTTESLAARTGAEALLAHARTAADSSQARAALDRARRSETSLDVRAPFDGVVVTRALREGEFVAAGGPILTLVDLGSLSFIARLPARDLPRVAPGQSATVHFQAWPERAYDCRIESIQPQVDPLGQVAEVRMRFLASIDGLRSDLFGTAEIVVDRHDQALVVPKPAVLRDDETGTHTIVEAVGDSLGVILPVGIGFESAAIVEITGHDVHPGMHVLVEGQYALPDSTRLRLADAP